MSANRQRLKNAIRNIALTPEERRQLLGDGKNKGDQPASASRAQSDAQEASICCDGSSSGNANPGVSTREPDADGSGQDGLDSDDPAKLGSGDGTLSGVTDCTTGEPICFDGDGFIPPDRWNSPNEPPVLSDYEEGYYYKVVIEKPNNSFSTSYVSTCSQAVGAINNAFPPCPEESWDAFDPNSCESASIGFSISHSCYPGEGGSFDKLSCDEAPNAICDEPPPREEHWPEDGCTNLIVKDGSIVGSKYDPENDGSYSAPRDSIDLCDENGNQITLRPSGQSDWKTIDAINGGDGYLYSGGKQIARVSGDEFTDPNV